MNGIAVDWSGGYHYLYDQAVANTVIAAAVICQLLQVMIDRGVKLEQIHLIGHNLGAHISGYVGREFSNLGRISGLGIFHIETYNRTFCFV
jgi:pancreatic triacylglycerol lipase